MFHNENEAGAYFHSMPAIQEEENEDKMSVLIYAFEDDIDILKKQQEDNIEKLNREIQHVDLSVNSARKQRTTYYLACCICVATSTLVGLIVGLIIYFFY